ncbi:MAG: DUF1190 domain-containing protein [Hyphomicrobiaceae bacterium]
MDSTIKQSIYVSSSDCVDGGLLEAEQCEKLIDAAIEQHNKTAATHPSLRKCESVEGQNRCERSFDEFYRVKLMAFLVTVDVVPEPTGEEGEVVREPAPPECIPLYPVKEEKQEGFVSADGTSYLENQLQVSFSKRSIAAYERYNKLDFTAKGVY